MKHRSVISFVLVAAALFSLPQLSHDLHALKGAVGARLHRELLHAFLSLPAGDPVAASPVERPAESLLACWSKKSAAPAAKAARVEAAGRAAARVEEKSYEQSAMIGDPANDPINNVAKVEVRKAAPRPESKVESEVAMIIPPDLGIDTHALANSLASADVARAEAEGMRVAYSTAVRFDANGPEWQKVDGEALRKLNATVRGTYEFRGLRDGAKVKVLKLKCGGCPATAPRLPRAPQQQAPATPAPVTFTSAEWAAGE